MIKRTLPFLVAAALALAGCGGDDKAASVAATPTATPTPTASPEPTAESTPAAGKCDEVTYKPTESPEENHPASNFFAPGAPYMPTHEDLDHLLLHDYAVVVIYAASTPKKTRDRLSDWTYKDVVKRTPVVVPDDSADALPVRARIATHELRCARLDWKRLTAFANRTDIDIPDPHDG